MPKLNPTDGRKDGQMHEIQQYPSASMSAEGKSSGYTNMSFLMPFLPSDLLANAQKPESVVNGRTGGRPIIPISVDKLILRHLDTTACQKIDSSFLGGFDMKP